MWQLRMLYIYKVLLTVCYFHSQSHGRGIVAVVTDHLNKKYLRAGQTDGQHQKPVFKAQTRTLTLQGAHIILTSGPDSHQTIKDSHWTPGHISDVWLSKTT